MFSSYSSSAFRRFSSSSINMLASYSFLASNAAFLSRSLNVLTISLRRTKLFSLNCLNVTLKLRTISSHISSTRLLGAGWKSLFTTNTACFASLARILSTNVSFAYSVLIRRPLLFAAFLIGTNFFSNCFFKFVEKSKADSKTVSSISFADSFSSRLFFYNCFCTLV